MFRPFPSLPKSIAILVLALITLSESAQIAGAQVGSGPIGVPALPGTKAMVKPAPLTVGPVNGAAPLLTIAQIVAGKLTPDEAWKQGLLSPSVVIGLLEKRQSLAMGETNLNLKRDLAGLLVRYAPQSVSNPARLDARVRLELCRYYSSIGDERAVALCEALIREKLEGHEQKQPTGSAAEPDDASLWLRSIIALAQYYEKISQWQKAGETWERALDFWQDSRWLQTGLRVDAARAYALAGNTSKSDEFYRQAASYGQGWFTGLIHYDRAFALIKQGKHEEARALLQQSVSGEKADQIQVGLLSLAGASYLKTGQFDLAGQKSQQAIDAYRALKHPLQHAGLEYQVERAEKVVKLSQQYQSNKKARNEREIDRLLR